MLHGTIFNDNFWGNIVEQKIKTLYVLKVVDAVKAILCITLVSFFSEKGTF